MTSSRSTSSAKGAKQTLGSFRHYLWATLREKRFIHDNSSVSLSLFSLYILLSKKKLYLVFTFLLLYYIKCIQYFSSPFFTIFLPCYRLSLFFRRPISYYSIYIFSSYSPAPSLFALTFIVFYICFQLISNSFLYTFLLSFMFQITEWMRFLFFFWIRIFNWLFSFFKCELCFLQITSLLFNLFVVFILLLLNNFVIRFSIFENAWGQNN